MPKKPMYRVIYDDILEGIHSGRYQPGERLDSEEALADKYEVSRITSKKALSMLYEKGYIVRKPGLGSFVATPENQVMLEKKKTNASGHTLGFVIDYVGNSFALNLFNQIALQATEAGYNLLIGVTHYSQETEMRVIELMKRSNCDGIILVPVIREFYNHEIIRSIADHYPILTIDRELVGLPAPCISTDHRKSCYMLARHLISRGHRSIAYINPRVNMSKSEEARFLGFTDAMNESRLNPDLVFTPPHDLSMRLLLYPAVENMPPEDTIIIKEIIDEFNKFMDSHPELSAIVCCTNPLALFSYNVLSERGLDIPDDISIVCFDEIERYYRSVYFTHIHQNEEEIAKQAIQTMEKLIHNGGNGKILENALIPGALIEGTTVSDFTSSPD